MPLTNPMKIKPLKIAFFGSSLVSSYWNGAATYYRGIIKALAELGHDITFYEPDALDRQAHRDMDDPDWARVVVYQPDEYTSTKMLSEAQHADIIVKASGVGVLDEWLEREVIAFRTDFSHANTFRVFWDVDAPATLERVHNNPSDHFRSLIPQYDMVLTYGGGQPVVDEYTALGARFCLPIYNAVDPDVHFPVKAEPRFQGTLGFLGNNLPDRESRVREYFLKAVEALPEEKFLLGGSGWEHYDKRYPNLDYLGHVYVRDHNAFNCGLLAVLNINRDSMARNGFSPPTRVFEAAGAGACLIMDRWDGAEQFLEPGEEVLLASSGEEVIEHLKNLDRDMARRIGEAARKRMLEEHTYRHRARQFEELFRHQLALYASA